MIDALPLLLGPEGYQISRSVRLRQSAGGYLNRTLSASGSTSQWTYSKWTKRGLLGSFNVLLSSCITGSTYYQSVLAFDSSDRLWYYQFSNGSGYSVNVTSTAVFRDPSAWYHVVMKFDATTSSMIVWVNNQQVINSSSFSTTNRLINSNNVHYIGNYAYQTVDPGRYDGYFTEINFIDGQVLTPNSFGETNPVTGVWQPKKYAGTYGTNGFYLNFSDNSAATAAAIGKDNSGNGNNWTPNNISVTAGVTYDSMLDVPTQWADGGNGRGNYATLNPLHQRSSNTLSAANLQFVLAAVSEATVTAGFGLSSGQWYWEVIPTAMTGAAFGAGVVKTSIAAASMSVFATGGVGYYASTGNKYVNGTATAYGASYAVNDVIGVALDLSANTITFYKNNVSQGAITIDSGAEWIAACGNGTNTGTQTGNFNFGQRPFAYTPPSGFKALNTLNLPTPTILKGNQYFDATLWDGNSTNARVITTNVGTVDFAWVKKRNGADDHRLANTVTGGNRHLQSNTTAAESTGTTVIQAFSGSTFTLGTDNSVNATGGTYVGWTWAEGATQGFDIVTYTGTGAARTVAHNLGVAPDMIIVKNRSDGTVNWRVYHKSIGATNFLSLNLTNASAAASSVWNNTAPTSTVFSVANDGGSNGNGNNLVAYLFAEVAGFSRFGSYTGNGSADGPFVFCGFRPRFVMVKRTDSVGSFWMLDSARDTFNLATKLQRANEALAEETSYASIDMLSNGFKLRVSSAESNASGGTYIFAAFSENPAKYSLAR